jgi:acetaldehyde dehydrogenase (acetylating)
MKTNKNYAVAILGTGNIGTDLLMKVQSSTILHCALFSGRNLASPGMSRAIAQNVSVSDRGIDGILESMEDIRLVFDATSAVDHKRHAEILKQRGIKAVDLTPSKIGTMCIPSVNLKECVDCDNVNMITCGGQAAIPIAYAIANSGGVIEYMETVSSIASRSAGPATRINLDEYLTTTEKGLSQFTKCAHTKAILVLNPAQPCVNMQTTVMAKIMKPDIDKIKNTVDLMVEDIKAYVPGYELIVPPTMEGGRLFCTVKVTGRGDYLPKYAGNLDIINCAAIAYAEAIAKKYMGDAQ